MACPTEGGIISPTMHADQGADDAYLVVACEMPPATFHDTKLKLSV